jgi:tRNA 2-thiouridine synthesizing protein A
MSDHVLDLRGLRCPLPVLKARKAMQALSAGDRLILECTDPMTEIDVPHYANQERHKLEKQERHGDLYVYTIAKGG